MRRLSNNAIAAFMVFIMLSSVISTTLISFYAQEKLKTTGKAVSQTGIVGIIVNGTGGGSGTPSGGGGGGGGGTSSGILVNRTHILDFRIKGVYVFDAAKDDTIIAIFDYGNYTFVVEDSDISKTKLVISSKSFVVSSDTTANLDLNLDGSDDLSIKYNQFSYTFVALYPVISKIEPNKTNITSPQEFIPAPFIEKPKELGILPLIILIFVIFFSIISFVLIPKYPRFGIIFVVVILVSLVSVVIYNLVLPKAEKFLSPQVMENRTESIIQHKAVLGQMVGWTKNIKLEKTQKNINTKIPKDAQNIYAYKIVDGQRISVNKIVKDSKRDSILLRIEDETQELEIDYTTTAPYSIEEKTRNGKKVRVIGPDTLHYENVISFTHLNESLNVLNPKSALIYCEEKNTYITQTSVADTNNNSIYDYVEWITPNLSNQTFDVIIITNAKHLSSNKTLI